MEFPLVSRSFRGVSKPLKCQIVGNVSFKGGNRSPCNTVNFTMDTSDKTQSTELPVVLQFTYPLLRTRDTGPATKYELGQGGFMACFCCGRHLPPQLATWK